MPTAEDAQSMFCHREEIMEMVLSELMLFVGTVAVFVAICTLENTSY
jgi:hypothetical protein